MGFYAAMVDRLDQNFGRVVEKLQGNGELNNTVIIFLTDNGHQGHLQYCRSAHHLSGKTSLVDDSPPSLRPFFSAWSISNQQPKVRAVNQSDSLAVRNEQEFGTEILKYPAGRSI